MTERFTCNNFVGYINRFNKEVELPPGSLDITKYRVYRPNEYWKWFDPILSPVFNEYDFNTITQTMDGRYWLHFNTEEDAAMFKLTHL